MTELISKEPHNIWCPYYHVQLDGKTYYVYEWRVQSGSGIAANITHCVFYLIDKTSYEAEHVTQGEYLHSTSNKPWREETALVIEAIRTLKKGITS